MMLGYFQEGLVICDFSVEFLIVITSRDGGVRQAVLKDPVCNRG